MEQEEKQGDKGERLDKIERERETKIKMMCVIESKEHEMEGESKRLRKIEEMSHEKEGG